MKKSRTRSIHSIKLNAVLSIIKQCSNIIFPLITYPYVSRVLGSTNLGKYSFADSILNVFLMTAALGIPTYAIREGARIRNDREKLEKFTTEIFSINLVAMLASYAVLFLLILFVPRLQKDVILTYILSITIVFNIAGRDWVNSIFEDFLYLSLRYVLFQTIALCLIFIFIKKPDDYIKYTVIMLIANGGGYAVNIGYTQKYLPYRVTWQMNLKKHLKPILFLFCSSIALFIYIRSDIIILGFSQSDATVGIYTLSSKVYSIIKSLLNAVTVVAIPRVSYYLGNGLKESYRNVLSKLWKSLITLIFPTIVGMFCLSNEIMLLIGGSAYVEGHPSLRILCIALFFAVFGCYYSQVVMIPHRKESLYFVATIVSAGINIILNLCLIPHYGMNAAALTTVAAEFCVFLICRIASHRESVPISFKTLGSVGLGCVYVFVICAGCRWLISSIILRVIAAVFISVIGYYGILLICKNEIAFMIKQMLTKRLRMHK